MGAKGMSLKESMHTIIILCAVDKTDGPNFLILRKLHASGMKSVRKDHMTIKYRS